ncbi:MAG: tetratricopeptide repeat protein [Acidobacteriota bacterium]|nr:tetratricopeptide repeat protein [Acidobacteriota bacterium]
MAFDKAKAIRAAEKHIAQGKIPAAIGEYRRIVEEDGSDFAALNTLGDLYARTGKKKEAVESFTDVAEHYRTQGFALKAIAMYKKVLRLEPSALEVSAKLAALYEGQGLAVEARAQYQSIVDAYTRAGRTGETLDILRRIAALDPQNPQIRLRVAELAECENRSDEAAAAYAEAGERLLARCEHAPALDAFTKAHNLAPNDLSALNGLVAAHSALGTASEAAAIIEGLLEARTDDFELLSMLVRARLEAGDASAAECAVDNLIRQEPSQERFLLDVARLHLEDDKVDEAVRVTSRAIEPLLAAREEDALLKILNEATARNPEQIEALRLLVRIHTWRRDDEAARAVLERLAGAAEAAGAEDEERGALMQLVRLAPDEEPYRERLQELGGWAAAGETIEGEGFAAADPQEVPTFENFLLSNDADSEAASPAFTNETDVAQSARFNEFEWNAVGSTTAPDHSATADVESSFADLNDDFGGASSATDASFALSPAALEETANDFQTVNFGAIAVEPPAAGVEEESKAAGGDERLQALLKQELEGVDFYLAQGYTDIARDTLDMLERQYGQHPQTAERRKLLQASLQESSAADETAPGQQSATPTVEVEYSGFTHYDVESEAAAPTVDIELDQAFVNSKPVPPAPTPAPQEAQNLDAGLADIFDEYRAAVEGEEPPVADYETHYNLGIAYQEMELLDDAIEEFQKATALASPRDGTPRYLQCCNLLGHCFMRKGMGQVAAMWFRKGLDTPGHTEDEYQALRYELGAAYEQIGDTARAIETFTEVYGVNVSYRGVSDKLRALRAQQSGK